MVVGHWGEGGMERGRSLLSVEVATVRDSPWMVYLISL